MKRIQKPEACRRAIKSWRASGNLIGFVPTMGALHEGHVSLIRAARKENDVVVVSIFVNPTQFGPHEDLKRYPRPIKKDTAILKREKVDVLFTPSVPDMYPEPSMSGIRVDPDLAGVLCGKFRPGHFEGVATVVAKLFNIASPDRAYFGAKDYQQAVVVRRLVLDLNFDVKVKILPIIREKDGLALSSRNVYLSPEERRKAVALSQTLTQLRKGIASGTQSPAKCLAGARASLRSRVDRLEYLELVDPDTLRPVRKRLPVMAALTACYVGKTRLIDNVIIRPANARR